MRCCTSGKETRYYLFEMEAPQILKCTVPGCPDPRYDQSADANNRHCSSHRAQANRKWNADRLEQKFGKAYNAGVEDMRKVLVQSFLSLGGGQLTGIDAARLIHQATGPICPGDEAKSDRLDKSGQQENGNAKKPVKV